MTFHVAIAAVTIVLMVLPVIIVCTVRAYRVWSPLFESRETSEDSLQLGADQIELVAHMQNE